MKMSAQVSIQGSREEIWKVITDIENCTERISGIEELEILERPESGLLGLKWRETRTMFGKTATEVMWITDVDENQSYDVRAESHGSVYESRLSIGDEGNHHVLKMDFDGQPQTLMAKLMMITMGWMFKGATEKALKQDLEDIKAAVEKG